MGCLENKTAFITGAGTGIGRAAASLFAREGARVSIAELNPDLGKAAEGLVREQGGDALFVETNITDEKSVHLAVAATVKHYGRIDILYNCAGGSVPEDAPVTDVEPWVLDHTLSLDVKGTIFCCRHAIPELIKAGGGTVVNMSSTAALRGGSMHIYSAAKGAIISLTRSLASSYGRDGVRVNAICPGIVLTDRVRARFGSLPEDQDGSPDSLAALTANRYPFGVGHADDIAEVALFLASPKSRMVNGSVVVADGGMSAF